MKTKAKKAIYLEGGKIADLKQDGSTLNITLPTKPVNEYNTVIKVTLAKKR